MSWQEQEAWQTELDADPAFRAAWDAFKAQLARADRTKQQAKLLRYANLLTGHDPCAASAPSS